MRPLTSTARNPYRIDGPALISFSGGRTSGYMLHQILDAYDGRLPDDVHVVFANTGREVPETLDFVQECSERWGVRVTWVEYRDDGEGFELVSHDSASRNGEPFTALMRKKGHLPNPIMRFCTIEMKIRPMKKFMLSREYEHWNSVIGLRADEPRRVASASKNDDRERWENVMPLAEAGATVAHVTQFWNAQPFDLRLPNNDGKAPLGNCDLCFLKGSKTILGIIRERPELAQWWAEIEEASVAAAIPRANALSIDDAPRTTGGRDEWDDELRLTTERERAEWLARERQKIINGARFRKDRPSYARMIEMARDQGDLFDMLDDNTQPCGCHD